MGCVCGRPSVVDDGRCQTTPPPASKLSAAVRREEEARKQQQQLQLQHARVGSRRREEVLERRRATMAMVAACQVRSPVPRAAEGEQVAAGWPPWLVAVAPEAVRGWLPRRAESFERLDKVSPPSLHCFAPPATSLHVLLCLLGRALEEPQYGLKLHVYVGNFGY
jgi:hypothetical protein